MISAIPFEQLVAETTEGITVSDARQPDYPLIWVNQGFLNMTGYALESVLGRNCRFLQGPGTSRSAVEQIRHALASRTRIVVELLNYRQNGAQFWNSLSISPVFGKDGEAEYFIGVQTDTTERRLREQREAEFIDNVAHEIKTPLTALAALLETLDKVDSSKREDLVRRMHSQMARLGDMLETLQLLSSARSLPEASYSLVDLREVAAVAAEPAEALAAKQGQRLLLHLPPNPVYLTGDASGLAAAISNLLQNALKYTPVAGEITLSLWVTDKVAHLSVRDSGIGIAAQHHERIFERFYRVDPARGRGTGGSGIGLALVAEVVQRHGGSVALESTVGAGSCFTLTLPLAGQPQSPDLQKTSRQLQDT